ncbi:MAG: 3-hydroxyacyl-CoA dehydrogenase [Gemmatimonadetes bacterium]|nr:3-hydroxyacyl-CoA dehydrogenase [Gemmatimonadota bacterium]
MTVAVVGCGVIGRSWIRVFTRAGHPVRVFDVSPQAIEQALAWHAVAAARDGRGGTEPQGATSLAEALGGAVWVQESGPEALPAKQALYAEMDSCAAPEAILASSTSTLDMTEISRGLRGARRCVVAHPVNPPHVVPAVELLGGAVTDPGIVARASEFLRGVGQTPVILRRYVPGFLLNRMQAALVREAISLLDGGVADADAIDAVIRDGLGLRWALMGPFGVANTNADGGVREYFTRYGASFRWLMDDLGSTPSFDATTIERIGAGVDAMYPGVSHEALRAWRDRMVERITDLKRDDHP